MDDLVELSERIIAAIKAGDIDTLDGIVDDDFVAIEGGLMQQRGAFLEAVREVAPRIEAIEFEHIHAEEVDGVGIVAGIQRATVALSDDRKIDARSAFTDAFHKVDGEWKVRIAHSAQLMPSDDR